MKQSQIGVYNIRHRKRSKETPVVSRGRPISGDSRKERRNVMLEPAIANFLRRQGDGNLSAGIQKVAVKAILEELHGPDRLVGIRHIERRTLKR
jgi:hypothetical protein